MARITDDFDPNEEVEIVVVFVDAAVEVQVDWGVPTTVVAA
jgi:hypothetical protein